MAVILVKNEWIRYVWDMMFRVIDRPYYLTWWIISYLMPELTNTCEIMAKLVCNEAYDYRLKSKSFSHKVCDACYLGIKEDTNHIVMQCPMCEGIRSEMLDVINSIEDDQVKRIMGEEQDLFSILLGKHPIDASWKPCLKFGLYQANILPVYIKE